MPYNVDIPKNEVEYDTETGVLLQKVMETDTSLSFSGVNSLNFTGKNVDIFWPMPDLDSKANTKTSVFLRSFSLSVDVDSYSNEFSFLNDMHNTISKSKTLFIVFGSLSGVTLFALVVYYMIAIRPKVNKLN